VSLPTFVEVVISGVTSGSLYVLMAGGLALLWGTLRIFNFMHGALLMLAAYMTWSLTNGSAVELPFAPAILLGVLAVAATGMVAERVLVEPFVARKGGDVVVMFTTLAGAILLANLVQIVWGPRLKQLPQVSSSTVQIGGTAVSVHDLVIIAVAPTLLLMLAWFLKSAKLGMAIRAVGQNRSLALLVGVRVRTIYMLTFALAGALAAVAGILLAGVFFMTPTMGDDVLLTAFIVVVLGGLGSLSGTVIAAYFIGLVESFGNYYVGLYWTPVVLFGAMITVLMVRPTGLLGER
jgi:branched-chain amino acid transport system permease protein